MARRSNKTAHVLNLIAGHEAQKEETEEAVASGETDAAAAPAPQIPADTGQAAPAPSAQNISVIDTTEKDPVADLIQQKLSDALNGEDQAPVLSDGPAAPSSRPETTASAISKTEAPVSAPEPAPQPGPEYKPEPESQPGQAPRPEPQPGPVPQSEPQPGQVSQPESQSQPEQKLQPEPQPGQVSQSEPQSGQVPQPEPQSGQVPQPQPQPEPEPEPEPAFAAVNVMEKIVQDKIIYYMRQFDVCTCDRCVADTIALTLNGLLPKYIVTMPAAVDPLLSYYTNRLISDVTVEATKACMIVKENPRHEMP